jgi:mannitol/fructose-specific phosphotransferase system IIA component (Ntr-type)
MHPLVNHLIQLQELALIRDEQKISPQKDRLDQLNEAIERMTQQLPPLVRQQFGKLHAKDHVVMSPVIDGHCALCNMKLPISLVQAVRMAKAVNSCPNCARLLYYPESAPRWVGVRPRRSAPRKVGVSRFSSHTLMIPRLDGNTKEEVIAELAGKMETEGFVDSGVKLVEMAMRREAILGTGVEHGLAIPHARGVEGGGLTLACGVHRKGLDWGAQGRALTRIVFFLAIPTAASGFYLKLLAGIMESFMPAEARKGLMAVKEPEDMWKALCKLTRATIK